MEETFQNLQTRIRDVKKSKDLQPVFNEYIDKILVPLNKGKLDLEECRLKAFKYFKTISKHDNLQNAFFYICIASLITVVTGARITTLPGNYIFKRNGSRF